MKLYRKLGLTIVLQVVITYASFSQVDSIQNDYDTTYTFSGDTLLSNQAFSIYKGQQLIVGPATGSYGWYSSIGFKSAFSFPIWFMRDAETKNNYDYQADPQKRINDKVKEYLHAGDTLTIKRIKKDGNRRTGIWYSADLQTKGFPSLKFRSNIVNAIRTGELMILK